MRQLLQRLHARLGDFWWYSLMIFMAARAADCLNVFVGLWLVPKYVPPSELGAVQPLSNFAAFLATPIAVFASTFRQELSNLAINREFGKLKTLMKSVFIAAAAFLFLAIVISHFLLPHYLERIRIAEGSLGMLIIVYSFISAMSPIFSNPLQALKKFKATTVISLIGAPFRFLTMLATMPLRALSGYFIGQASVPSFSIVTSLIALRKELSVRAEPYWTRPVVRRFSKLFLIFGIGSIAGGIASLVETTVLRQRIPEIESAAYYMTTRFSDIASFLCTTLMFTIFPFAAKLAAQGKSTNPLVLKSSAAILVSNAAIALFFYLFGRQIISLLPNGAQYSDYWWAIELVIVQGTLAQFSMLYTSAEISANRFRYMLWSVPLCIMYAGALLFVTGYGYFTDFLPNALSSFLATHNIMSLSTILWWSIGYHSLRLLLCIIDASFKRKS